MSSEDLEEVKRLLALDDKEFEEELRKTFPEVSEALDLEKDSFEIFSIIMNAVRKYEKDQS
jgi:hypothetical protein